MMMTMKQRCTSAATAFESNHSQMNLNPKANTISFCTDDDDDDDDDDDNKEEKEDCFVIVMRRNRKILMMQMKIDFCSI